MTSSGCNTEQATQLAQLLGNSFDASVSSSITDIICNLTQNQIAENVQQNQITELSGQVDKIVGSVDTVFLLFSAYLVFLMQCGFAMLCAGSVRSKNTLNILLKNVIDACVGAMAYYLVGFGVAYGNSDANKNPFIGTDHFALHNYDNFSMWLFQFAFAATAATIVSGSVAERCAFEGYLFYSVFLTAFVQPVVAHWVWDVEGWISPFASDPLWGSGLVDFAGCSAVHMVGGLAGLTGAWIIGPRIGRFDTDGTPVDMPGHSAPLVVCGTFILWFGWYGFNPGSMFMISSPEAVSVVSRAAVTTTLGGASGGVTLLLIKWITSRGNLDLTEACNGALCGLVGITAGCSVVEPWAAIIAGMGGAMTFDRACALLLKLQIDDPLAAAPMHGACGMWGLVFVALFAKKEFMEQTYGWEKAESYGLFYGGDGRLLACQLVAMLAITGWTCVLLGVYFKGLMLNNLLRVPHDDEMMGMDMTHHGGPAYTFDKSLIENNPNGAKYSTNIIGVKTAIHPLDGKSNAFEEGLPVTNNGNAVTQVVDM